VATSTFGWSMDFFMRCTPNFYMKSLVNYLEINNPDAIEHAKEVYMDQVPFWN